MRTYLAFSLLAVAACDPFNPDLGDMPFRCGEGDACPSGYECVEYSQADQICEPVGGGDGEPFDCANDAPVEPNDSTSQPYRTPVASQRDSIPYGSLAICPAGDVDVYQIDIVANATNFEATLQYQESDAPLSMSLLTQAGQVVVDGAPGAQNRIQLDAANLAIGVYFVQVEASQNDRNNYELNLSTSP